MSTTARAAINKGLWLGLLGIVIFSVTLPMTRLAVGTPDAPQMSGVFVAMGRAVVAAVLSAALLLASRASLPMRQDWLPLAITASGVVFGFPLLTSIAMRHVEAMHASVIVGVLPLATAAVGALLHRQRPSMGFWLCAALGSALVVVFAVLRSGGGTAAGISFADLLLLAAMGCAAVGYCYGGRLAHHMRAEHVICWVLGFRCRSPCRWLPCRGQTKPSSQRPGGVLAMWRCSRCGWAFLPGTAGWPWAARYGSVRYNWCSRFC